MRILKFIILLFLFTIELYASTQKNVLILNSYHKGFSKSDHIISTIEKVFYEYPQINIDTLYMDSKQVYSRDYIKELSQLYKIQLKNRKFDLIIAIDRFAYLFAIKNHSIVFKGEPILFAGLEDFSQELIKIYNLENRVNGIIQDVPFDDNIKLIEKMIPNLKKLYIINDRSQNGDDSSIFIRKEIYKIKNRYEVEYLRDFTLDEFIKYFNIYRKDEAILFVRYSTDPNGDFYKENEIATALNNFKIPVFVLDDLYLNKGAIGGKILSFNDTGKRVGNLALDIIYENVSTPIFDRNRNYKYIFDYEQMKKYDIALPPNLNGAIVLNMPQTFFQRYRDFINIVFIISPFLILLIFILVKLLYEKQRSEKRLLQRVAFDKVLLGSIDNPTYWQDSKGEILDANRQFCDLIDVKYSILIGNTLNFFYHKNSKVKKLVRFLEDFDENQKNSRISYRDTKGHRNTYLLNKKRYFDPNSEDYAYVTVFTDITKELEYTQEREKQNQYLIQQSKLAEIGDIFSSIAHQWKSPLVEITALAQDLFFLHSKDEKEEDSYHINKIMVQAQYMTKTINDFQDFIVPSKEKKVFDLELVLRDLLNIVRHNMKYNYIEVRIEKASQKEFLIYGYQNEFMQALLNIINNAKEVLLKNSEKDRFINIKIKEKLKFLVIDIIDNGGGVDKKIQKRIFEQYYTTKDSGHGIGLYMTKIIIEDKLDGRIRYKELDNGSCFRILIKECDENIGS